ncbi:LemA family protein [Deferribacter autotrophicus]|uniref:LemA family protein n=1 Tax=Deferribacter autotrophicus TaxID=500465 RepID=A0A5A8F651_9BACT|nr:LemA family protein [Deferribacter autotrophicus]KAA0257343.1 LemA family protein [Deferribacter autotrophicus]
MTLGYIIIGLIILLFLMLIYYYNKFVKLKNQVDESWSGIDVQLKRRYDLIPNLVETVKEYAKHEKETLENVVKARNMAMNAKNVEEKAQAENMLTGALKTIFALAENYPDLKANKNFLNLQNTLSEIEDNIQNARRYYNAVVRDYNILCEAFPSVIIANMFGFKKREFFEIEEAERKNVKVKF